MTKFENKSFSVGIGGEAYRKGWEAIDWSDKGDKKEEAAPVEAAPAEEPTKPAKKKAKKKTAKK